MRSRSARALFADRDRSLADTLRHKAAAAYALGVRYPGVCQTAPAVSPYFYEEDNWVDDMELGAALLHQLTGERRYLRDALGYARREPVTPWMGADTARHYQWYPWHNAGHYEAWTRADAAGRAELARFYREGLRARRSARDEWISRRHSVHLVFERSHGVVRHAGRFLSAHDGRRVAFANSNKRRSTGCSARIRGARRW